ncbi:MAG: type IV pilus secretin PilQ [Acidobacteriota bacterium]
MIRWKRAGLSLLVLLGLSCAGNPPLTDPARDFPVFPETISLTGLKTIDGSGGTDVIVEGNFPFNYSSYEPDPTRLIIEVADAEAESLEEIIALSTSAVDEVRVTTEDFPGGSRLVRLEFRGLSSPRHDLFLEGNNLRVRFFNSADSTADADWVEEPVLNAGESGEEIGWPDSVSDSSELEDSIWWDSLDENADDSEAELETVSADDVDSMFLEDEDYDFLGSDALGDTAEEHEDQSGGEDSTSWLDSLEPAADVPETEPEPLPANPAESLLSIISEDRGAGQVFRLVADGSLSFEDFRLENPNRSVIDLHGVTNRVPFQKLSVESSMVGQVRVAQFQVSPEMITRVVFDMTDSMPYQIRPTSEGLEVAFLTGEPIPEPVPDPEPFFGEETEFLAGDDSVDVPPLLAETGGEIAGEIADEEHFADSPDHWESSYGEEPRADSEEAYFEDFAGPADDLTQDIPSGDGESTVAGMDPVMDSAEEMPAAMDDDSTYGEFADVGLSLDETTTLILKGAKSQYQAQSLSGDPTKYTGTRISLDFKDADLKDVFRLFHEILGYNIVLDPGVSGKLTIVLNEVPADQALDIILKNNGLDKMFENNVIRIATTQKMAQEAAARRQLMDAKELEQVPITFARKLSYAKAQDVVKLLRMSGGGDSSAGGIISRKGSIRFDERTNTLIISDIPTNIEPLNRLIDVLDEETPQVMIEARIVETDRDFERSFGINWGFNVDLDPAIGTETNSRFPHRVNVDYAVNLPAPAAASTLGLSFGNIRDSIDLNFTLEAFELNGDVKILSSPRIATQNNQTATIEQGVQIPVVNTTATEINVEFISASLKLEVTPQITKDRTIIMDIRVDNSSPDFVNRVGDVPPIITERAQTQILVEDGGTAVIGGIYRLDEAFSETGVPGLKKIPFFGWLFKNRVVTRGNTELLIFITPRILTRD